MGAGGLVAVAAVAGLLGGCATSSLYPPPTAGQMAAAESAVAVAKQDGQPGDANSARHLRLAEQQLTDAKQLAAVDDNRGASLMLARAQADAELSQVLSRKAKNAASAEEAERVLQEVRGAPGVAPPTPALPAPQP